MGVRVAEDAAALRGAWEGFSRRLTTHLDVDRRRPGICYWRVREGTPGTHADGHVHYHVLLVAPYVHHAILRLYWARSLPTDYQTRLPVAQIDWSADGTEVVAIRRTLASGHHHVETIQSPVHRRQLAQALVTRRGPHGRPLTEMPWPVIDVRGAAQHHRSAGSAPKAGSKGYYEAIVKTVSETAKYVVKDLEYVDAVTGDRKLVDPAIFAELYMATDGQRRTSCTMTRRDATGRVVRRGWWYVEYLHPYERTCVDCGHMGPLECQIERIGERVTRGP
ncbi:MAG: hypothetical protein H6719_08790 [Sandaracinaceae bacterium]|nr:hypothetical protein [Sandaracinaceae bacterium]